MNFNVHMGNPVEIGARFFQSPRDLAQFIFEMIGISHHEPKWLISQVFLRSGGKSKPI